MRTPFAHAILLSMDDLDSRIKAAAKKRERSKAAFDRDEAALRELLVEGRAAGKGPSHMAKLSGFTREWVAKIAPDPARQAGASRGTSEPRS